MSQTAVGAAAVRDAQRATWDAVAPAWLRWQPVFEQGARVVTERLLDLAGVGPGLRVLDLGSGVGEPAVSAAGRVGPDGEVIGLDLSPEMTAIACRHAGGPLSFVTGDLEDLDRPPASLDVALSRWGLMFVPDRQVALARLATLLRPGGVLAAAVWGPPPQVPMISLAFRTIADELRLPPPPPGQPGPFVMADPGALRAEVAAAGFTDVIVEEVTVPFRLASVDEFVAYSRDVLPPMMRRTIVEHRGTLDDPALWTAVRQAVRPYARDGAEVVLPSRALCVRGFTDGPA
ncbi:methyltransferase domain-containing protein [Micromonospora sp. NPDC007271]|uniref:class I SAM-dependent methyltransferase n=1 Tax=Micromonospora sp. NPDC007271 TaxID=3154587 RepID=UPI0033E75C9A